MYNAYFFSVDSKPANMPFAVRSMIATVSRCLVARTPLKESKMRMRMVRSSTGAQGKDRHDVAVQGSLPKMVCVSMKKIII